MVRRAVDVGGSTIHIAASETTVEIWNGPERLAVHPRAARPSQRLVLPGQWAGLPQPDDRRRREPLGRQQAAIEVEVRPLAAYDVLVGGLR